MPHVGNLSFHGCKDATNYRRWTQLINRKDVGWKGVNKNTKVCSNHFILGKPFPDSPNPVLYLKGYGLENKKRPPPRKRDSPKKKLSSCRGRKRLKVSSSDQSHKREDHEDSDTYDQENSEFEKTFCDMQHHINEHCYSQKMFQACSTCSPFVQNLIRTTSNMQQRIDELENGLLTTKNELVAAKAQLGNTNSKKVAKENIILNSPTCTAQDSERKFKNDIPHISIDDIKESPSLLYLHTGIQNYETFSWILKEISHGA